MLPVFLLPAFHQPAAQSSHSRVLSTTPPFLGLFNSKKAPLPVRVPTDSDRACDAFRRAVEKGDDEALAQRYGELVQAYKRQSERTTGTSNRVHAEGSQTRAQKEFPLRKADLQAAMKRLCASRRPAALDLLSTMFDDMSTVFGYEHRPRDLHHLMRGHSHRASGSEMLALFQDLKSRYDWEPLTVDWNVVISAYASSNDLAGMDLVLEMMRTSGVAISNTTRNMLLSTCFSQGLIERATDLSKDPDLDLDDLHVLSTLLHGFIKAGALDEAGNFAHRLRARLTDAQVKDRTAWHALIRYDGVVDGVGAAERTAIDAIQRNFLQPDERTYLTVLLSHDLDAVQTSDDALRLARRVERVTQAKAGRRAFSILILSLLGQRPRSQSSRFVSKANHNRALITDESLADIDPKAALETDRTATPAQIHEAQLLYDDCRLLGISPDAKLVHPLMSVYCRSFLPALDKAFKLYQDLCDADARRMDSGKTRPLADVAIFNVLLQGCVRARDVPRAIELLNDMRRRGVKLDAMTVTQYATLLMQASSDHEQAFRAYAHVHALDKAALDAYGYTSIIATFSKLRFPKSSAPHPTDVRPRRPAPYADISPFLPQNWVHAPPEYFLAILQDMRVAGHAPSAATYTVLLDYYGKSGDAPGVASAHELLKLDEQLEPDLPLINALMNAYNRVGRPRPVLSIWDSLRASRQQVDGITIGILFDTCGRSGNLSFARRALAKLRADGVPLSKGAWDAWIECLARSGRAAEAAEVVFGTMRHEQGVAPDAKTLQTLLKFAARDRDTAGDSVWYDARNRIRAELPHLWEETKGTGIHVLS